MHISVLKSTPLNLSAVPQPPFSCHPRRFTSPKFPLPTRIASKNFFVSSEPNEPPGSALRLARSSTDQLELYVDSHVTGRLTSISGMNDDSYTESYIVRTGQAARTALRQQEYQPSSSPSAKTNLDQIWQQCITAIIRLQLRRHFRIRLSHFRMQAILRWKFAIRQHGGR